MSDDDPSSNGEGTHASKGRFSSTLARVTRLIRRWVSKSPASVVLAGLVAVAFIATIPFGHSGLEPQFTIGLGHPWWTFFSSVLWTTDGLHCVLNLLLLLTLGVALERIIGTGFFLVIGFGSYWAGSALAFGVTNWLSSIAPYWSASLQSQSVAGIADLLAGIAMATSVRVNTRWRRRIRITFLTIVLMMLGFAGTLDALATLLTGLVGLVAGELLWHPEKDTRAPDGGRREGRLVLSLIVGGVVVGTMLSLSSPQSVGLLTPLRYQFLTSDQSAQTVAQLCSINDFDELCLQYTYLLKSSGFGSRLLALMPLIAQLILAWGLRGGRRAAFWGTLALQSALAAVASFHLAFVSRAVRGSEQAAELVGLNADGSLTARLVIPVLVPLALMVLIAMNHGMFTVRASKGTYVRFWVAVGTAAFASLGLAVLLTAMFAGSTGRLQAVGAVLVDFFTRLLPGASLPLVDAAEIAQNPAIVTILAYAPIIPWLLACVMLWQSFGQRALPNAISRERYMELVRATEAGTMGWISTWDGNHYWESSNAEAGIAYRVYGGVALTVSDPAASPEDLPAIIEEFKDFCVEQDLTPAFYSVHHPVAEVTTRWGWPRLQVAEETAMALPDLAFTGKKFQDIRTALNRGEKEGIRPIWTTWDDCPQRYRDQIQQISDQWVSEKSLPEMGFTLGGIPELDDPEVRILLAVGDDDQVHGVTSWMPVYRSGAIVGWTLDFMRRRDGGFRPVMEYLIAQAALWAKQEGYQVLSLSGAPLAKAQRSEAEGELDQGSSIALLDGLLDTLGSTLEPVYGFRSLLRFKAKFRPEYFPVYLTIPDVAALGPVGLAVGHAYVPDLTIWDAMQVAQTMKQK